MIFGVVEVCGLPVRDGKAGACQETNYNSVYIVSTNLVKMINPSVKLIELGSGRENGEGFWSPRQNKKGCRSDSLKLQIEVELSSKKCSR